MTKITDTQHHSRPFEVVPHTAPPGACHSPTPPNRNTPQPAPKSAGAPHTPPTTTPRHAIAAVQRHKAHTGTPRTTPEHKARYPVAGLTVAPGLRTVQLTDEELHQSPSHTDLAHSDGCRTGLAVVDENDRLHPITSHCLQFRTVRARSARRSRRHHSHNRRQLPLLRRRSASSRTESSTPTAATHPTTNQPSPSPTQLISPEKS